MTIEELQDPTFRSLVVEQYKKAGLGGERYGVICPKCNHRICPQGYGLAQTNTKSYCICKEQYTVENHENIGDIMKAHGLSPTHAAGLHTNANMHEPGKGKKKARKKKKTPSFEEPTKKPDWPTIGQFMNKGR